jgi:hypothetical protein
MQCPNDKNRERADVKQGRDKKHAKRSKAKKDG